MVKQMPASIIIIQCNMAKIIFLVVLISILDVMSAHADNDEGYKHYLKGNYEKSSDYLEKEIDQGKKRLYIILVFYISLGKGLKRIFLLHLIIVKKLLIKDLLELRII